jgi:hypothetical protein
MKFAKIVFWIAGGLGVLASVGLYVQPGSHAYYGLIAGVLSWQGVFFLIGWEPRRYRPMMIPAVLEKLIWVVTWAYFYWQGQVTAAESASNAIPHGLLGVLFVIAFFTTRKREPKQEIVA